MCNSNNGFGGCWWIVILTLTLFYCGGRGNNGYGDCGYNNDCGDCDCQFHNQQTTV